MRLSNAELIVDDSEEEVYDDGPGSDEAMDEEEVGAVEDDAYEEDPPDARAYQDRYLDDDDDDDGVGPAQLEESEVEVGVGVGTAEVGEESGEEEFEDACDEFAVDGDEVERVVVEVGRKRAREEEEEEEEVVEDSDVERDATGASGVAAYRIRARHEVLKLRDGGGVAVDEESDMRWEDSDVEIVEPVASREPDAADESEYEADAEDAELEPGRRRVEQVFEEEEEMELEESPVVDVVSASSKKRQRLPEGGGRPAKVRASGSAFRRFIEEEEDMRAGPARHSGAGNDASREVAASRVHQSRRPTHVDEDEDGDSVEEVRPAPSTRVAQPAVTTIESDDEIIPRRRRPHAVHSDPKAEDSIEEVVPLPTARRPTVPTPHPATTLESDDDDDPIIPRRPTRADPAGELVIDLVDHREATPFFEAASYVSASSAGKRTLVVESEDEDGMDDGRRGVEESEEEEEEGEEEGEEDEEDEDHLFPRRVPPVGAHPQLPPPATLPKPVRAGRPSPGNSRSSGAGAGMPATVRNGSAASTPAAARTKSAPAPARPAVAPSAPIKAQASTARVGTSGGARVGTLGTASSRGASSTPATARSSSTLVSADTLRSTGAAPRGAPTAAPAAAPSPGPAAANVRSTSTPNPGSSRRPAAPAAANKPASRPVAIPGPATPKTSEPAAAATAKSSTPSARPAPRPSFPKVQGRKASEPPARKRVKTASGFIPNHSREVQVVNLVSDEEESDGGGDAKATTRVLSGYRARQQPAASGSSTRRGLMSSDDEDEAVGDTETTATAHRGLMSDDDEDMTAGTANTTATHRGLMSDDDEDTNAGITETTTTAHRGLMSDDDDDTMRTAPKISSGKRASQQPAASSSSSRHVRPLNVQEEDEPVMVADASPREASVQKPNPAPKLRSHRGLMSSDDEDTTTTAPRISPEKRPATSSSSSHPLRPLNVQEDEERVMVIDDATPRDAVMQKTNRMPSEQSSTSQKPITVSSASQLSHGSSVSWVRTVSISAPKPVGPEEMVVDGVEQSAKVITGDNGFASLQLVASKGWKHITSRQVLKKPNPWFDAAKSKSFLGPPKQDLFHAIAFRPRSPEKPGDPTYTLERLRSINDRRPGNPNFESLEPTPVVCFASLYFRSGIDFVYVRFDGDVSNEAHLQAYEEFLYKGWGVWEFFTYTRGQLRESRNCVFAHKDMIKAIRRTLGLEIPNPMYSKPADGDTGAGTALQRRSAEPKTKPLPVAKMFKYSGLLFNSLDRIPVTLKDIQVLEALDIKSANEEFCFTDGCGLIGLVAAEELWRHISAPAAGKQPPTNILRNIEGASRIADGDLDGALTVNLDSSGYPSSKPPTVFQIRLPGVKGILVTDPTIPKRCIVLRGSMRKLVVLHPRLDKRGRLDGIQAREIAARIMDKIDRNGIPHALADLQEVPVAVLQTSKVEKCGLLNAQVMALMLERGVPVQLLKELQRQYTEAVQYMTTDARAAIDALYLLGHRELLGQFIEALQNPNPAQRKQKIRQLWDKQLKRIQASEMASWLKQQNLPESSRGSSTGASFKSKISVVDRLGDLEDPDEFERLLDKAGAEAYMSATGPPVDRERRLVLPLLDSRRLYGIADAWGLLKDPNSCMVRVTCHRTGEPKWVTGRVCVTRNPCYHPGDLMVVNAIEPPGIDEALSACLRDVLVLPCVGSRPIADMCGGGDLDGDTFLVVWDERIVNAMTVPNNPFDYMPEKMHSLVRATMSKFGIDRHDLGLLQEMIPKLVSPNKATTMVGRIDSLFRDLRMFQFPTESEADRRNRLLSRSEMVDVLNAIFALGIDDDDSADLKSLIESVTNQLRRQRTSIPSGFEEIETGAIRNFERASNAKRRAELFKEDLFEAFFSSIDSVDKSDKVWEQPTFFSSFNPPVTRPYEDVALKFLSISDGFNLGSERRSTMPTSQELLTPPETIQPILTNDMEMVFQRMLDEQRYHMLVKYTRQAELKYHQLRKDLFSTDSAKKCYEQLKAYRSLQAELKAFNSSNPPTASESNRRNALLAKLHETGDEIMRNADMTKCVEMIKNLKRLFQRYESLGSVIYRFSISIELEMFKCGIPVYDSRESIVDRIFNNQITLIQSATGSGKSTCIPFFLEHELFLQGMLSTRKQIVVAQPRRQATVSLAERLAMTRESEIGEEVGYHIGKSKARVKKHTTIINCVTYGMLVNYAYSDPFFSKFSIVILDEVHEDSTDLYFLFGILKRAVSFNKNLRLVLMSAKVDVEQIHKFFESCEIVEITGRVYQVEEIFVGTQNQDGDSVVERAVQQIFDIHQGELGDNPDILVFLPLARWIEDAVYRCKELAEERLGDRAKNLHAFALYSGIPEQEKQFILNRGPMQNWDLCMKRRALSGYYDGRIDHEALKEMERIERENKRKDEEEERKITVLLRDLFQERLRVRSKKRGVNEAGLDNSSGIPKKKAKIQTPPPPSAAAAPPPPPPPANRKHDSPGKSKCLYIPSSSVNSKSKVAKGKSTATSSALPVTSTTHRSIKASAPNAAEGSGSMELSEYDQDKVVCVDAGDDDEVTCQDDAGKTYVERDGVIDLTLSPRVFDFKYKGGLEWSHGKNGVEKSDSDSDWDCEICLDSSDGETCDPKSGDPSASRGLAEARRIMAQINADERARKRKVKLLKDLPVPEPVRSHASNTKFPYHQTGPKPDSKPTLHADKVRKEKLLEIAKRRKGVKSGRAQTDGTRRVIFCTNVAETSLTFPNIGFVIDSGLQYSRSIRPILNNELTEMKKISKAAAIQRKGRAGRLDYLFLFLIAKFGNVKEFPWFIHPSDDERKWTLSTLLDCGMISTVDNTGNFRVTQDGEFAIDLGRRGVQSQASRFLLDVWRCRQATDAVKDLCCMVAALQAARFSSQLNRNFSYAELLSGTDEEQIRCPPEFDSLPPTICKLNLFLLWRKQKSNGPRAFSRKYRIRLEAMEEVESLYDHISKYMKTRVFWATTDWTFKSETWKPKEWVLGRKTVNAESSHAQGQVTAFSKEPKRESRKLIAFILEHLVKAYFTNICFVSKVRPKENSRKLYRADVEFVVNGKLVNGYMADGEISNFHHEPFRYGVFLFDHVASASKLANKYFISNLDAIPPSFYPDGFPAESRKEYEELLTCYTVTDEVFRVLRTVEYNETVYESVDDEPELYDLDDESSVVYVSDSDA
ncbi:Pre-mRNA-splicing factor ATP-dependent RNA helicase dhx15 [Phlyctochytrium bullatum]|nr:Pre-mRNA-splicing factor ATP-dependent RNA helicase dhx15 [Phlyctochytrium bullatum]